MQSGCKKSPKSLASKNARNSAHLFSTRIHGQLRSTFLHRGGPLLIPRISYDRQPSRAGPSQQSTSRRPPTQQICQQNERIVLLAAASQQICQQTSRGVLLARRRVRGTKIVYVFSSARVRQSSPSQQICQQISRRVLLPNHHRVRPKAALRVKNTR